MKETIVEIIGGEMGKKGKSECILREWREKRERREKEGETGVK